MPTVHQEVLRILGSPRAVPDESFLDDEDLIEALEIRNSTDAGKKLPVQVPYVTSLRLWVFA